MHCPYCGTNETYTQTSLYGHIHSVHKSNIYARILAMAIRLGDEERRAMATQVDKEVCLHLWKAETFHDGSVAVKCSLCNASITIGGHEIKIYHMDGTLKVNTIDIRTFGV